MNGLGLDWFLLRSRYHHFRVNLFTGLITLATFTQPLPIDLPRPKELYRYVFRLQTLINRSSLLTQLILSNLINLVTFNQIFLTHPQLRTFLTFQLPLCLFHSTDIKTVDVLLFVIELVLDLFGRFIELQRSFCRVLWGFGDLVGFWRLFH